MAWLGGTLIAILKKYVEKFGMQWDKHIRGLTVINLISQPERSCYLGLIVYFTYRSITIANLT